MAERGAPGARPAKGRGEPGPRPEGGWWRRWTVHLLLLLVLVSLVTLLSSALHDLTPERFYDERHTFRNLRTLLLEGRLVPPSRLYPSLSYLPYAPVMGAAEWLHRATGAEWLQVFEPGETHAVTATGYVIARSVSVLMGIACLLLTYRLGRRTASGPVGLLAAALLSVTWGFLLVSIKLKPDVVVMLLVLVSYGWSLSAVRRPGVWSYALAGLGVGLAAAAKYHGAVAALPLVVGSLATAGWRDRTAGSRAGSWVGTWTGTWAGTGGRLALAGATSVATFFALNPWPSLVLRNVRYQRQEYARRGAEEGVSHWQMIPRAVDWMFDDLGPLVFACVVLGCAGLALRAVRRREGGAPGRLDALVLVTMIVGYLLFFSVATTYFTFQNFVPVLPFLAVAAAWAMVSGSEAAFRRLPGRVRAPGRRIARWLLWVPAALGVLSVHYTRTYDVLIPETVELAQGRLAALTAPGQGPVRTVLQEPIGDEPLLAGRTEGLVLVDLERVTSAPEGAVRGADVVIFPARRLEGDEGAAYERLLAAWEGSVERVEPRWFVARGPGLVLAFNDWRLEGEPATLRLDYHARRQRVVLDRPLRRGEVVSLGIRFWSSRFWLLPQEIEVRGWGPVALHRPRSRGRRHWAMSGRMVVPRRTRTLVFELPELPGDVGPSDLRIYRWRSGGSRVESRPAPDSPQISTPPGTP